ncbi:medium-chain acyl-CoA ligase ACSF2, mitochondrial-like [Amphiura filiformis]|uniref:medium-chain acyl-CoA ligase ACSF2, mitochondrial-like n=1 Tax=Amphiura filiformis TaxID=82378 RepID=UPI003B223BB5
MTFAGSGCYVSTFLPLVRGCTTVVLYPVFDVHTMAKALQDEQVTDGFFFIHHISDLVDLPEEDTCNIALRSACLSGSVVPPVLRHKVTKLTKYVTSCFGMTEMLGTHFSHPLDPPHVIENASVFPTAGNEVKIVDSNDRIVPVNTLGELHFRGFSVFMYYWGNDEMTKETKLANGWMRTGDLAKMDEDGYIRILGRIKDIIIKAACNLSPMELEGILYKHPDIVKALVAGVPDSRTGEEVCACIVKRPGSSVTEEEIKSFCQGKVYSLLNPKYVLFVDTLPTTETGKFSRKRMSEIAQKTLNLKTE